MDSDGSNFCFKGIYRHPLFILTIITIITTIYLLSKQMYLGVTYYDVYVYLNNALIFSGIPVGNLSVIYLSPLMPFLTSLILRAGYVSSNVIFILDSIVFSKKNVKIINHKISLINDLYKISHHLNPLI